MKNLLALIALATTVAFPLYAQPSNCAPSELVEERLSTKYNEEVILEALRNDNTLLNFYANDESGTWTVVIKRPDGISCVVDSGRSFEVIPNV